MLMITQTIIDFNRYIYLPFSYEAKNARHGRSKYAFLIFFFMKIKNIELKSQYVFSFCPQD